MTHNLVFNINSEQGKEIRLPLYYKKLSEAYLKNLENAFDKDTYYSGIDKYHLNYCGMEDCAPGHFFGPEIRSSHLLHFVKKGRGIYRIGNQKTYQVTANQLFLIFPGDETFYQADFNDPWSYDWVAFSGNGALEWIEKMGFNKNNHVINIHLTDELDECIQHLLSYHKLTFANELRRASELTKFLAILLEDQQGNVQEKNNYDYPASTYVKQAMDFLIANFDQPIKIGEIADFIGINRSYLANSFKQQKNISPQDFLLTYRMEKAASYLSETALPIKEISKKVGYPDPLAFSKMFKKQFGISPKTFREENHQHKKE